MRGVAKLLPAMALIVCCSMASGQSQTPNYVPSETKVAILPVLNTSGEKWEEFRTRQVTAANEYLDKDFRSRGFDIVPKEAVADAIAALKLDMSDEENWKRDNLYKIGEATGARLVVLVIITNTAQHKTPGFFAVTVEGWVDLKIWVVDTVDKQPIISAKTVRGSSKHADAFGALKGSDLQVVAVSNGLRDAFKSFVAPYPAKPQDKPKPGTSGGIPGPRGRR